MLAMVPGIELVVETVQLVHCCRIPWIVFEALQLVCLDLHDLPQCHGRIAA